MRFFALAVISILSSLAAIAQQSDFNFINFSSKNGLSSNTINVILKDRNGYMWFATSDGLNKFDGINFKVYRHNADTTSIGPGAVMTLQEDRSGNLWIGTDGVLSLYNREKDAFINYNLSRGLIRTLCIDHAGNIWIGTYMGLLVFDTKKRTIVKEYRANPVKPGQLMSEAIINVFEDSHSRIWIGTIEGLHLYVESSDNFKRFPPVKDDPFSLPDKIVRTIAEDFNGNIWIGTNDGGLSMLQPDGKHFRNYKHNAVDHSTLSSDRIYAISVDDRGKLWVGTEEGLNIFDPGSGKAVRINNDQRNKYSFIGKSVRSIFIDKDGIYWFGTYQSGVNKYDKNLAFFNLRQSNPFDPLGLSSSIVSSFVEDPSGNIYVGTDGGGLNLFNRNTGLFEHIQLAPDPSKARSILAMEKVGNELWIGTYTHGLHILNMKTGATRHYDRGSGSADLVSNEIFCIKEDSRGNVWIGTNGNGVSIYDPASGTFQRFDPKNPKTSDNILPLNGFIRSIEEDRFGNIWIGSHGSGIAIYDPWRKNFKLLNHDNSGLSHNIALSIYKSRDGNMWVGSGGEGLCRFDYNTNKFIVYSESQGLANGYIYKILEDDAGKLWVSTNKGISCFDPANKKFKNYSHYNGLQQSTFSMGAGLRTNSGELFFGGLDGFNYFDPQAIHANRNVPSLVFTDLKISNRSVIPGDKSAIKQHISIAKEIRLNYKQNFSIDFAALNYTAPQENQYSYKLDGFEKNWNDVGSLKTAVYTNLGPGKYTFRLKARSDDGSWTTPEASITIYVKPPIWLTTWAYIFYVVVIILTLWAIRHRGIQKIKKKFELEQERQQFKQMLEQERREAERQHEFDQVKIKFLTNLSHEFRTPISLIVDPADKLFRQETNKAKQDQLSLIKRNARRLLNLVNQLLDFRKLEESEMKLNLTDGDLISFVKEVGDSFKDISERKRIDLNFSSSVPYYYTSFDRDKVERILFNLLSNAFKFTKEGGRISVKIGQHFSSGIKIIVADTGIGMTNEVKEKIFERFFQGSTGPGILNQGNGIGLSIIKEFVKMHGGTIEVESTEGKGSSFTVLLPCKPIPRSIEEIALSRAVARNNPETILPKNHEAAELEKPTVLLIDDHEDFLKYLSDNLKPYYKIIEAADGKQGWQKVLSAHPTVIISDINMPEMDGITLCRKIRSDKRTCHIPIILLTALTGDANQLTGLNTGANDYLTKPFNFEILNLKIRNLLNLNQNLKNTYTRQLKVVTPDIQVESDDERLLLKITQYIEDNIDNTELSVEELSKHVYMSRGSLYTKIVNLTGETPVEFIRSVKLDKAAALLANSDMKISQVGYTVGFATPNYFARAFKAKFNLSPSEYARLKRKPQ